MEIQRSRKKMMDIVKLAAVDSKSRQQQLAQIANEVNARRIFPLPRRLLSELAPFLWSE
jgi:hypothetical protein